jgi:predicted phosphodiesterase
MTKRWTAEEEHLLRILRPTNTYQEIETAFAKRRLKNLAGFTLERSAEAIRKKCDRDGIDVAAPAEYADSNPVIDQLNAIRQLQTDYKAKHTVRKNLNIGLTVARKILCISDIHFPFANEDMLAEIITAHSDANICVINGDLLDGYMFSTFDKNKRIAALSEYQCGFNFVKLCAETFEHVVITDGNHDVRPARVLKTTGLTQEASQVLRPNLIARIANGEELDGTGMLVTLHDFSNVHYSPIESWYTKVGKTIFVHPHGRGSAKPGFTVAKAHQYFASRYEPGDYDSVVCGHTHKVYKGFIDGKLLIEQGTLADVMAYAHSPSMDFISQAMNGFAIIYQDKDGNTDFNISGPVFLGTVTPPKKSEL